MTIRGMGFRLQLGMGLDNDRDDGGFWRDE